MTELEENKKEIFIEKFIEAIQKRSSELMYSLCANYEDMHILFGDDLTATKENIDKNLKISIENFFSSLPEFSTSTIGDSSFYNITDEIELPTGYRARFIDSFSLVFACKEEDVCIDIEHLFYVNGSIKINNMAFVKYNVVEKSSSNDTEITLPSFLQGGQIMPPKELEEITPELSEEYKNFFSIGILFEGNVKLEEDFNLNISDGLLIVIRGDLYVKGNIINSCGSTGDLLVVLGDVFADNLIAGGSVIDFKKNVYIKHFIYPYYNDGSLGVHTLKSGILLDDGEHFTIVKNLEDKAIHFTYGNLHTKNQYPYSDFTEIVLSIENDEHLALEQYLLDERNNNNLYQKIQHYIEEQSSSRKVFTNGEVLFYSKIMKEMHQRMSVGLIWQTGFTLQDIELNKNDKVKFYTENLIIDGDYLLDVSKHDGIKMIYIDGDLEVKGSLYHTLHEEALFLIVKGDVKCQNLINAKGLIFIKGKLIVNNILYLYDAVGAGWIYALGGICSKLAIVEDDIVLVGDFDEHCSNGSIYSELTEYIWGQDKPAIKNSFNFKKLKDVLPSKYWDITAKYKLNKNKFQMDILEEKIEI